MELKLMRSAVTAAVPDLPSLVAAMRADPGVRAATSPPSETVATDGLSLDHARALLSTCPAASRGTAISWTTPPTTVCTSQRTVTAATGAPPGTASQVPALGPWKPAHVTGPLSPAAGGPATSPSPPQSGAPRQPTRGLADRP